MYPDTCCHHSGCFITDPGLLSMHHDTGRDNFYFLFSPAKQQATTVPCRSQNELNLSLSFSLHLGLPEAGTLLEGYHIVLLQKGASTVKQQGR